MTICGIDINFPHLIDTIRIHAILLDGNTQRVILSFSHGFMEVIDEYR